jgi:hypothetical protein
VTEGSQAVFRAKESYATYNRRRKVGFALEVVRVHGIQSVLFVGVSEDDPYSLGNVIETQIAAAVPDHVATGIGEGVPSGFASYQQADGLDLPFGDGEFDLVYSNAVIEHVGQAPEQARFLAEHARVGRYWIATTPNRAFPVESHSNTLVNHWRRSWSHPDVSRLLTKRDFIEILPPGGRVVGFAGAPTLSATNANTQLMR